MHSWKKGEGPSLGHCWRLANVQYVSQAPMEVDALSNGETGGKKRTSAGEWDRIS